MDVNSLVFKSFLKIPRPSEAARRVFKVNLFQISRGGMPESSRGCCRIEICPILVNKVCSFDLVRKESTGSADKTGFLFCKVLNTSRLILYMSCDVAPGASAFPGASRGLVGVFHGAWKTTRARLF